MHMGIEPDEIIEDFMGPNTRAAELREMQASLKERLAALKAERAQESKAENIAGLDRRIAHLKDQIAVLTQEEIVSQFVEDSIRATLARPATRRLGLNDEDEE
jgi:hypothetical protein